MSISKSCKNIAFHTGKQSDTLRPQVNFTQYLLKPKMKWYLAQNKNEKFECIL